MVEEWCDVLNPGECILGECVGDLGVVGVFTFDVELMVEFFEVGCDFAGFNWFILVP